MIRIIEWNCQGAFRKKNEKILSLDPDILIVSECENEERLNFGKLTPKPTDFLWYGDSPNKGIGIFSFSDYKFELFREFNSNYKFIIPIKVTGRTNSFVLFAIWAYNKKVDDYDRYIRQVWFSINYYINLLDYPVILTRDFNSNKIWDKKRRIGNHSDVVAKLGEKGIVSLYHIKNNMKQGEEIMPTFFMARKENRPYHIDYFFASKRIIDNGFNISIGNYENWTKLSDHSPLIIDIEGNIRSKEIVNSLEQGLNNKFDKILPITKEKFNTLISNIIYKARNMDMEYKVLGNEKERMEIIEDAEKIIKIDELIRQMRKM